MKKFKVYYINENYIDYEGDNFYINEAGFLSVDRFLIGDTKIIDCIFIYENHKLIQAIYFEQHSPENKKLLEHWKNLNFDWR